jgi:hypothetical protein
MSKHRKEWTYYDERAEVWVEPYVSREDLAALYSEGTINDYTEIINVRTAPRGGPGMGLHGVAYSMLGRSIDITFDPDPEAFVDSRRNRQVTSPGTEHFTNWKTTGT